VVAIGSFPIRAIAISQRRVGRILNVGDVADGIVRIRDVLQDTKAFWENLERTQGGGGN
jgi:hypothetical protein